MHGSQCLSLESHRHRLNPGCAVCWPHDPHNPISLGFLIFKVGMITMTSSQRMN